MPRERPRAPFLVVGAAVLGLLATGRRSSSSIRSGHGGNLPTDPTALPVARGPRRAHLDPGDVPAEEARAPHPRPESLPRAVSFPSIRNELPPAANFPTATGERLSARPRLCFLCSCSSPRLGGLSLSRGCVHGGRGRGGDCVHGERGCGRGWVHGGRDRGRGWVHGGRGCDRGCIHCGRGHGRGCVHGGRIGGRGWFHGGRDRDRGCVHCGLVRGRGCIHGGRGRGRGCVCNGRGRARNCVTADEAVTEGWVKADEVVAGAASREKCRHAPIFGACSGDGENEFAAFVTFQQMSSWGPAMAEEYHTNRFLIGIVACVLGIVAVWRRSLFSIQNDAKDNLLIDSGALPKFWPRRCPSGARA